MAIAFFWLFFTLALDSGESQPVAREWVSVWLRPARLALGKGDALDARKLVDALGARLSALGIRVQRGGRAAPGGAFREWRLEVTLVRRALRVRLIDPDGGLVVARRLLPGRRSSHDLVQIISLSAIEGMASEIERLEALLPPGAVTADAEAATLAVTEAASPSGTGAGLRPGGIAVEEGHERTARRPGVSEKPWSVGMHVKSALARPGNAIGWGTGLFAGFEHGPLAVRASFALWLPEVVEGDGYRLWVQSSTACLGLGMRLRLGRWQLGTDLGPALRMVFEERRGERVTNGRRWYINAGVVARLYGRWRCAPLWSLQIAAVALRFYSHQGFTAGGSPILDTGSTLLCVTCGWALVF